MSVTDRTILSVLRASLTGAVLAVACYATSPSPANGQEPTPIDLAEEALTGIAPTDMITEGNLDVVEPFETTTPPEADLNNANIENAISDRRARGDTVESRAFNAMEDSAASRPEYEIDTDDPLITRTETITDTAPQTIGDLFTSDGEGICEVDDFEGTPLIDAYCERSQAYQERTCSEDLEVTLDRHDRWRCIQIPEVYPETCIQRANVTCNNPSKCLTRALNPRANTTRRTSAYRSTTTYSANSYRRLTTNNTITFQHLMYATATDASWVLENPFAIIHRRMQLDEPGSGVNLTSLRMEVTWQEATDFAGNRGECQPNVVVNGNRLMEGITQPFHVLDGSLPFRPCMAFGSHLLAGGTGGFTIRRASWDVKRFIEQGHLNVDIAAHGMGYRGIIVKFTAAGGCCINPQVTYEELSCG